MKQYYCEKCGSTDVFIKELTNQTGLYCSDCGKWIKWLGKQEKLLVQRYIEANNKKLQQQQQEDATITDKDKDILRIMQINNFAESIKINAKLMNLSKDDILKIIDNIIF